jgi:hypothetical protein
VLLGVLVLGPRSARLVPVAALALGAALLAGCGGPGSAPLALTPVAAVQAASQATAEAGTARMSLVVEVEAADASGSITSDGVLALDGSAADLRATLPADLLDEEVALRVLVAEGTTYLQVDGLPLLSGTWIEVGEAGGPLGVDADAVTGGVEGALDALREVTDVREVGVEEVGGVSATHYRADLDAGDLAGSLAALGSLASKEVSEALAATTVTVDVWIDEAGRLVRLEEQVPLPGDGSASITYALTDFGVPVEVEAPADAVNLDSIMGLLESLAGDALAP